MGWSLWEVQKDSCIVLTVKVLCVLIKTAYDVSVPAGQALAVDRNKFSESITKKIDSIENIEVIREEVGKNSKNLSLKEMLENGIVVIATGPLTSDGLSSEIKELTGE